MRKTGTLPACAVILLSMVGMIVIGCGQSGTPTTRESTPDPLATKISEKKDPKKLLADWPTESGSGFAGALVISGQMMGYHEPCGCSANQKGGLVRRAAFVEMLRERGWNLGLVDLGSLGQDEAKARGGPSQTRLKYATTLKALQLMGYGALGFSVDDLKLGTGETMMQIENTLLEEPSSLKAVAANVIPTPGLGFEAKIRPSIQISIGATRVGVTAVVDPESFQKLQDADKEALLTVQTPESVLPAVLADLEKETAYQVLLVQGSPEMARTLAEQYKGFDVVVATSPYADPEAMPEVLNDGKTWLVSVGRKGMYLGVIGLYPGASEPMRYKRVELNESLDPLRPLAKNVHQLIGQDFQRLLKEADVLGTFPKRPYALFDAPADARYMGAESCKTCHPNTFAKWSNTKHALAYAPLVNDPRDDGRNREQDAACITCHTTGFEYVGGFVSLEKTPQLQGNQCENCHGPGSRHAAAPDDMALRQSMKRSSEDFDRSHRCINCHDEDNDPKFDFAKYWPQIIHNKLDDYSSPDVHQGLTTTAAARP